MEDHIHVRIKYSETHGAKVVILCRKGIELYDRYTWYLKKGDKTFYLDRQPYINGKKTTVKFHRELLNLQDGEIRDHCNGNGLDNRLSNLRPVTPSQNSYNTRLRSDNTSGIKGVSFHTRDQRWVARVQYEGQTYYKSSEDKDEIEVWARGKREELHGEFTNHG